MLRPAMQAPGTHEPGTHQPTEHHGFPCAQCGAKLEFKPGADAMACPYCGHQQSIGDDREQAPIVEYDLQAALAQARRQPVTTMAAGAHELQCNGCGATQVLVHQADHCAFCGSPMVVAVEQAHVDIAPESVLPFKLAAQQAHESFRGWVKSRWFAPNDLERRAKGQKIDGAYLPYWTYDSRTTTRYSGARGIHYWVTQTYRDSQGRTQTRQVRKTRWYPTSGSVFVPFDDVLVCASRSLPAKLVDKLEPWDLPELRSYDPSFLSGFVAERYGVDLEQGFQIAEKKMEPVIRTHVRRDIGGDAQQIWSLAVHHADTTFKHCLLPIWISSFKYQQKVYRFVVNGRTGTVSGERPYSWIKITLTVLAALAVIGLIIFLLHEYG
jgi:hypothetical protein